jgi:LysM repeat protein/3D (Asp-Asp-Asp) domain-containing protein
MQLRLLLAAALVSTLVVAVPPSRAAAEAVEHVVQPGDTLGRIAVHYGVSLAELVAVNAIANPDLIHPGQVLHLPGAPAAEPAPAAPEQRAELSARGGERPAEAAVHIVQPGDTLTWIARHYGVSVSDLLALNPLPNPNLLNIGQEIILPGDAAAQPAPVAAPAPRHPAVGGRFPIGTTITGKVTMYCLRGVMRYGEYVHQGAAAGDPSVFPAGTIVEVAGLGRYVIKDTFARDLGDVRVDIWEPSCSVAIAWGLRYLDITVVGP